MSALAKRSRVRFSDGNDSESMSRGGPFPPGDLPSDGGKRIIGEGAIGYIRSLILPIRLSLTCYKTGFQRGVLSRFPTDGVTPEE